MRAALIALSCLVAGCGGGKSDLDVSVSASNPIAGVTHLVVTVTDANGRASQPATLMVAGGQPVMIPPERNFSLVFDSSVSGTLLVDVEARDAADTSLGSGRATATVTPGQASSAAVILKGGHPMNDGGTPDDAGLLPDSTQPVTVDASPDLSPPVMIFAPATSFPTGKGPVGIVRDDVNGDGKLDLVVACNSSNTVDIHLGNGDGTFQAPKTAAVGNGPVGVVSFDTNGDQKSDVVALNSASNSITILLGDGTGALASPSVMAVGNMPMAIIVNDFNNDGRGDLAVAAYNSGLHILLGNGNGTFKAPTTIAAVSPLTVNAFDFDRNNKLDLVVACDAPVRVLTFAGDGLGGFTAVGTGVMGGPAVTGAVGLEFNGDNHPDVVTSHDVAGEVGFLGGDGTGNYAPGTFTPVDGQPFHIRALDLNGDNHTDVFTSNHGTNDVSILLGNGDGTFQPAQNYPVGMTPAGIAFGDFNGDLKPDLAVANYGSNSISILLQK